MKYLISIVSLVCFLNVLCLSQKVDKSRLIKIPQEFGVLGTVTQPDCPLKIIETELLTKEDGAYPIVRYIIQNQSRKAIRYFSVGFTHKFTIGPWHRYGSGAEGSVGSEDGKGRNLLLKGDTYSNWRAAEFEIVPMNSTVKEILTSNKGLPRLRFLGLGMVTKIIFEDGSVFDAKSQQDELFNLVWLSD